MVAPPSSLEDILDTVAGETSELGVRWTLGPDSFRQLNLMLAGEIVEPARQIVRLARAYLNIITQADNPELRAGIQKTLGPEVDELYLAIQLFVTKIPSELTDLIEEQRRLFKGGKAIKKKASAL
jgi:hypothetical protein